MCNQNCEGVRINGLLTNKTVNKLLLLLYVDDTIIFSRNEKSMCWKLKMNAIKSKIFIFRGGKRQYEFDLNGEKVEKVKQLLS